MLSVALCFCQSKPLSQHPLLAQASKEAAAAQVPPAKGRKEALSELAAARRRGGTGRPRPHASKEAAPGQRPQQRRPEEAASGQRQRLVAHISKETATGGFWSCARPPSDEAALQSKCCQCRASPHTFPLQAAGPSGFRLPHHPFEPQGWRAGGQNGYGNY